MTRRPLVLDALDRHRAVLAEAVALLRAGPASTEDVDRLRGYASRLEATASAVDRTVRRSA